MTSKRKILLIYTGGTIGMVKDYSSNALKAFDFSQILGNFFFTELVAVMIKTLIK